MFKKYKLKIYKMAELNEIPWDILNKYFTENPHFLTNHHLKSYNDFFLSILKKLKIFILNLKKLK